jgi:hypothetical protein
MNYKLHLFLDANLARILLPADLRLLITFEDFDLNP